MTGVRTVTLTEFLLARIAEDEVRARMVYEPASCRRFEPWALMAEVDEYNLLCVEPSRALAECDAKRRLVQLADEATGFDMNLDSDRRLGLRDTVAEPYLGDQMLAALAMPYADHPDYRPEWKP